MLRAFVDSYQKLDHYNKVSLLYCSTFCYIICRIHQLGFRMQPTTHENVFICVTHRVRMHLGL
jgi:hypothetical protein